MTRDADGTYVLTVPSSCWMIGDRFVTEAEFRSVVGAVTPPRKKPVVTGRIALLELD